MWHLVSGWEEMMKSPTANRAVTRGKGNLLFILKPKLLLITSEPPLY